MALGLALEQLVSRLGLRARLRQEAALVHWPAAVGPEVGRHTRPLEIRGGVLRVQVRNSTWANQLAFLESDILARLNALIGEPAVRDIRWVVGAWREAGREAAARPPAAPDSQAAAVVLAESERQQIRQLAEEIPDEAVREVWERFLVGEFRRRAWRLRQGWHPCPCCGVPHPHGPRPCPACRYTAAGHGKAALKG